MLSQRLRELELDIIIRDSINSTDYQVRMARRLRELVFLYLQGQLPIPDGPAVINLREGLNLIGGMQRFIDTQSPNGAWATDIELTLLSELLGVNFVVKYGDRINPQTGQPLASYLSQTFNPDLPTITLINTKDTAWDASINGTKDRTTVHDGNCGYNSFAQAMKPIVQASFSTQSKRIESKTSSTKNTTPSITPVTTKKIVQPTAPTIATVQSTISSISTTTTSSTSQINHVLQKYDITNKEKEDIIEKQAYILEHTQTKQPVSSTHTLSNASSRKTTYEEAYARYSNTEKEQIRLDYLYALKIAMEDLPGVAGRPSTQSPMTTKETNTDNPIEQPRSFMNKAF